MAQGSTGRDESRYAGFWWRALALLVDVLVVQILSFLAGVLIGGAIFLFSSAPLEQTNPYPPRWVVLMVNLTIPWLYFALMESSRLQGTIGKRVTRLRVTDLDGGRLSFGRATVRHFAKFISVLIIFIGFAMAGFTRRKQGLHDMIAGALVVRPV